MVKETAQEKARKAKVRAEIALEIAQERFEEKLSEAMYAGSGDVIKTLPDKLLLDSIANFVGELRRRKLGELGLLGEDGTE
jgi:hypothetical protein